MSHLTRWTEGFPGLLWHIELPKSKLFVLNNWRHPLLGQNTSLLLKDRTYRKQVIHRDDRAAVEEFWDGMFSRESAAVSFRLREQADKPLLLQGWAPQHDSQLFCGMLQCEVQADQEGIPDFAVAGQRGFRSKFPTFLVDIDKKLVIKHNDAADRLFSKSDGPILSLHDIAPGALLAKLEEAWQAALEHDAWSGPLSFVNSNKTTFATQVKMTDCTHNDTAMVRITFLDMSKQARQAYSNEPGKAVNAFEQIVQQSASLKASLTALLRVCSRPGIDGLMFSDIQAQRGLVHVHGVGEPFANLPWGEEHAYEGTIAQDIERFTLSSLTVDDTRDSIKSIDWVLFNPRGVRSYFAKPFFDGASLHAVLIFVSRTPAAFPPDSDTIFAPVCQAFAHALERWRKDRQ